jgi:hypothetical protein
MPGPALSERSGVGEGGAPNMNLAVQEAGQGMRRLRARSGYELAEPSFSGEGPIFKRSESESAVFKRASAKCRNLLGGPSGGPGTEGETRD